MKSITLIHRLRKDYHLNAPISSRFVDEFDGEVLEKDIKVFDE